MANSYFKFKQFTIQQEHCAMKVSTEACILGAWIEADQPDRILDIGTGTGLLSLMLAQRFDSPIDAVEIDEKTAEQAVENIFDSPWTNRVRVVNQNIRDYAKKTAYTYDLIVCNPPFFESSLKSHESIKNLAKHETEFFDKILLVDSLSKLLSVNGCAFVIYPEDEAIRFKVEITKAGLFCQTSLIIRNKPKGSIFRKVMKVSKKQCNSLFDEIVIRDKGVYTDTFTKLLSEYYLNF